MIPATMVPWHPGTMIPWYHGTMVPWCHGTMAPGYHGTTVRHRLVFIAGAARWQLLFFFSWWPRLVLFATATLYFLGPGPCTTS